MHTRPQKSRASWQRGSRGTERGRARARVERRPPHHVVIAAVAWIGIASTASALAQSRETFTCRELETRADVLRIVGPNEDIPPDFAPWQVSLQRQGPEGLRHFCGGSLIHPSWALTAAHCVDRVYENQPGELTLMHGSPSLSAGGERRQADRVILHERYNPGLLRNDIALIRLARPFSADRDKRVGLGTAQFERDVVLPGACSVVTGWGDTLSRLLGESEQTGGPAARLPDVRLGIDLPIVDRSTCADAYDRHPELDEQGLVTAQNICAGYREGGSSSCQGDSGGPLVVFAGPLGWLQVGIVSFGAGCAQPESYGVYTRVSQYTDWIVDQISRYRE